MTGACTLQLHTLKRLAIPAARHGALFNNPDDFISSNPADVGAITHTTAKPRAAEPSETANKKGLIMVSFSPLRALVLIYDHVKTDCVDLSYRVVWLGTHSTLITPPLVTPNIVIKWHFCFGSSGSNDRVTGRLIKMVCGVRRGVIPRMIMVGEARLLRHQQPFSDSSTRRYRTRLHTYPRVSPNERVLKQLLPCVCILGRCIAQSVP